MTTALNVALLLIGTIATLTAFGGETWRKGPEPLLNRVTTRGWFSLSCLALAFICGISKEAANRRKDKRDGEHAATQETLHSQQVAEAQRRAEDANGKLRLLEEDLTLTRAQLYDAKRSLVDVRDDLHETRSLLSTEADANLVTALSSASTTVEYASITFHTPVRAARDALDALFNIGSRDCQEISEAGIYTPISGWLQLKGDALSPGELMLPPHSDLHFTAGLLATNNASVFPTGGTSDYEGEANVKFQGQPILVARNPKSQTVLFEIELPKHAVTAAEAFAAASRGRDLITLHFGPKSHFDTAAQADQFRRAHIDMGFSAQVRSSRAVELVFDKYPKKCSLEIQQYWGKL